jgi:S1-C subfamily serine protease
MSRRRASSQYSRLAVMVAALAATVAVVGAGYLLGYRLVTPTPAEVSAHLPEDPTPSPTPLADIARNALASTVTIEALTSGAEAFGTGWLFDAKGDFVTNDHVVAGAEAIRIRDRAGNAHVATLLNSDRVADIAMVRSSDGFTGTPLAIGSSGAPDGTAVVAIASSRATGHDDVSFEHVQAQAQSVPVVGGNVDPGQATSTTVYTDMLQIGGTRIFPGNSGGPVLNASGRVVGIVTLAGKRGNIAYAIPIVRVIKELGSFAAAR